MRRSHTFAACAVALAALAAVAPLANAVITTATFATYASPSGQFEANNDGGEPSIGVNWNSGAVMYQAGLGTYRISLASTPPSWTDVSPVFTSVVNLDPILFTDSTTGRTWAGGLEGSCSVLGFSDNDGASWTPTGNACSGTIDHPTIGAGPYAGGQPVGATYQHATYYCAQASQDACATSENGGVAFGAPTPWLGSCGSLHGHVKVANDGAAYVPDAFCGNNGTQIGGEITTNNGLTWNSYVIPGAGSPAAGFDPSVAVTNSSWVYEAWQDGTNHLKVALSKDHGATWINMTDLSGTASPAVVTATFPAIVAGDDNRAAVAYLGTTTSGNAFASGFNGVWDLYVSYTFDGGHSWTTYKVTSDPVQRGWICASGTTCGSGRNLLDFIDAAKEKNGNLVVAYADGCVGVCAGASGTKAESTSAWASIAVQTGGSNLFG